MSSQIITNTTTGGTPFLAGDDGNPLKWPNSGSPGGTTDITVALATSNYTADQSYLTFSASLPTQFVPLLQAAEEAWEGDTNVNFITVPDAAESANTVPDIRIGVALMHPATMNFISQTYYSYNAQDQFEPDTIIGLEDPSETSVTALQTGDYSYAGFAGTVFQHFLHDLGYAPGLADNQNDPTSIMNATLSASNMLPDAQDIAAIRQLYGPATQPVSVTRVEFDLLHTLAPQLFTTT
nr:hypothetical protein [uncultured Rhodopila sp.]